MTSIISAYRKAVRETEREEKKRAREAARRYKELKKIQDLENAKEAYFNWNEHVKMLVSFHKSCSKDIRWRDLNDAEEPRKPEPGKEHEKRALQMLEQYKPSIFDKIFFQVEKKQKLFQSYIEIAKKQDFDDFQNTLKEFENELDQWNLIKNISKGVLNNELKSYYEAINYFEPFSDLEEFGLLIKVNFNTDFVDIDVLITDDEIVPNEELRLTSTGKLSKRKMGVSKYNELYQDYVCSISIKIAREIFAYLPIPNARVNIISHLLNTKTGHMEELAILSVFIPSMSLDLLNLKAIDPSDCMENFKHNMNFRKIKGFTAVEKIKVIESE